MVAAEHCKLFYTRRIKLLLVVIQRRENQFLKDGLGCCGGVLAAAAGGLATWLRQRARAESTKSFFGFDM